MNLTIKSFKTWSTNDGGGYQFNLYKDGKKIAFVHNDGNGGEIQIDWLDEGAKKSIIEYVKSLSKIELGDVTIDSTVGILMDDLVNKHEWEKKLARHRKQGILFRLLSDPKESFRTIKTLDMDRAKAYLDKTYPNSYILV